MSAAKVVSTRTTWYQTCQDLPYVHLLERTHHANSANITHPLHPPDTGALFGIAATTRFRKFLTIKNVRFTWHLRIVYQTSRSIRSIHCRQFFFLFENLGKALRSNISPNPSVIIFLARKSWFSPPTITESNITINHPSQARLICRPTWSEPPSLIRSCRIIIIITFVRKYKIRSYLY